MHTREPSNGGRVLMSPSPAGVIATAGASARPLAHRSVAPGPADHVRFGGMATFIARLDRGGDGLRLAVKDLIDVQGVPTTAGSKAVADRAIPALADAMCLAGARAAGAVIVGKTNLNELAYGASGLNEHFGTPVNPLDPDLLPGGSSSGSAVAVGAGDADVAYGSDTGGSIRVPAAYCGVAGLKTTHGRVPLDGVWPLAPSLDTVGPMARDVAGGAAGPGPLAAGVLRCV